MKEHRSSKYLNCDHNGYRTDAYSQAVSVNFCQMCTEIQTTPKLNSLKPQALILTHEEDG